MTAVGAALLSNVGKLQLARDDLAREMADLAQGRAGHLRIDASPSNSEVLLPQACSTLLMEAPRVTFNVAVLDNDALLPALRRGELDICVMHAQQSRAPEVTLEVFREDEFVVYCASRHRLAKRRSVTLDDLADERWAISAAGAAADRPRGIVCLPAFAEEAFRGAWTLAAPSIAYLPVAARRLIEILKSAALVGNACDQEPTNTTWDLAPLRRKAKSPSIVARRAAPAVKPKSSEHRSR